MPNQFPAAKDAFIKLIGIHKSYQTAATSISQKVEVLRDISLGLPRGAFVTIFGPNGCGKSTLLNIIAGLAPPDKGHLLIDHQSPETHNIGYVFQDFRNTLFPWKRAVDNIAYPLELRGVGRDERRAQAVQLVKRFKLDLPMYNYPYQLSGGQQQMTSIARSLANQPSVLLLDEPFSALDYETRFFMQQKIMEIWHESKTTILFVSHELDEALYLADKVVFLTRRPARILRIIDVDLPRPRTPNIMEDDRFFKLRKAGIAAFREALNAYA